MTRTVALGLLLAACAGAPEAKPVPAVAVPAVAAPTWAPAKPRDPLVLTDRAKDPTVGSSLPPGTRVPLAAEPIAAAGIELPNGTFLAPLNGVVGSMTIRVEPGTVVAPVVAVSVASGGVEWYEHLDGSYSTCIWIWRPDLGRWDTLTQYMKPAKGAK